MGDFLLLVVAAVIVVVLVLVFGPHVWALLP